MISTKIYVCSVLDPDTYLSLSHENFPSNDPRLTTTSFHRLRHVSVPRTTTIVSGYQNWCLVSEEWKIGHRTFQMVIMDVIKYSLIIDSAYLLVISWIENGHIDCSILRETCIFLTKQHFKPIVTDLSDKCPVILVYCSVYLLDYNRRGI